MAAFTHHVFVCGNARELGHKRGSCDPHGDEELHSALKKAVKAAGLATQVRANRAGCLDQCEHGPVIVIYPQGVWYGRVKPGDAERIVRETLVKGQILDDLAIPAPCLNNFDCQIRERYNDRACRTEGCSRSGARGE